MVSTRRKTYALPEAIKSASKSIDNASKVIANAERNLSKSTTANLKIENGKMTSGSVKDAQKKLVEVKKNHEAVVKSLKNVENEAKKVVSSGLKAIKDVEKTNKKAEEASNSKSFSPVVKKQIMQAARKRSTGLVAGMRKLVALRKRSTKLKTMVEKLKEKYKNYLYKAAKTNANIGKTTQKIAELSAKKNKIKKSKKTMFRAASTKNMMSPKIKFRFPDI